MDDILDNDQTQNDTEVDEEVQSIWEAMGMDDDDEPYAAEQEDADEQVAKDDKEMKKLAAKMDNMQKKFETTLMKERISKFQDSADEVEKGLFRAIAADVKDMSTLDKAMALVKQRAVAIHEAEAKYQQELEKQAQEKVAKAWGTGPVGTPTPRTNMKEEEIRSRLEKGDTKTGLAVLMEDDGFVPGF